LLQGLLLLTTCRKVRREIVGWGLSWFRSGKGEREWGSLPRGHQTTKRSSGLTVAVRRRHILIMENESGRFQNNNNSVIHNENRQGTSEESRDRRTDTELSDGVEKLGVRKRSPQLPGTGSSLSC
jgi:hypothetical protein